MSGAANLALCLYHHVMHFGRCRANALFASLVQIDGNIAGVRKSHYFGMALNNDSHRYYGSQLFELVNVIRLIDGPRPVITKSLDVTRVQAHFTRDCCYAIQGLMDIFDLMYIIDCDKLADIH
jgi:hypothetical protein